MEQNITTLNLPRTKINKLQKIGKNFCSELSNSFLNSQSITVTTPPPTRTALEILEEELLNGCVLSYNTELDQVLIDEIVPKRITELAGFPGSGKTQICFQLCITAQLPRSIGGLEGEVVYIDTNKNFASHRLRELSKNFIKQISSIDSDEANSFTEENILKHVYVFTCSSILELSAAVLYLEVFLKAKMIVVTNDFTTRVKDNEAYYTPSFGESFFDRINSRICLSKSNEIYCAELVKSVIKSPIKVNFGMF